jgi:hypothetical protein
MLLGAGNQNLEETSNLISALSVKSYYEVPCSGLGFPMIFQIPLFCGSTHKGHSQEGGCGA